MTTMQTAEQSPATPNEIWAILRETAQRQKEAETEYTKRQEEYDRQRARDREEWAELKELFAATREMIDENSREMSRLGLSFGDVIEHLVAPRIEEHFEEIGMNLRAPSPPVSRKIRENGQTIAQVDLQLENAESVMIVEVKARVNRTHVMEHVSRLEKLRGWYDRRGDHRKLYGAIAGAVFHPAERKAARGEGFFVLVQAGDTMRMDIPEGFRPREW